MRKAKDTSEKPEILEEVEETSEEVVLPQGAKKITETAVLEKNITKVGNLLKEMRIQKGLKISEISKKLCIRACYLEAIEESRYQDIPEFPYGAGFIRSYADFLGLNSSNIIELYKEETNINPDKNIYVLEPQAEATVPGKKYVLISILALGAVYFGWYFYNLQNEKEFMEEKTVANAVSEGEILNNEQPIVVEDYSVSIDTETKPEEVKTESMAIEPKQPQIVVTDEAFIEPTAENTKQPETNIAEVKSPVTQENKTEEKPVAEEVSQPSIPEQGVAIEVLKEVWIEAKDSEKLYLSKVLQPGDVYIVPDVKGIILSAGKVDGVKVYVNGKVTTVFTNAKKMNISLDEILKQANH